MLTEGGSTSISSSIANFSIFEDWTGQGVGCLHFNLHSVLSVYVPVAENGPLDEISVDHFDDGMILE